MGYEPLPKWRKHIMHIEILSEHGIEEAAYGAMVAYKADKLPSLNDLKELAFRPPNNAFLKDIFVWVSIDMPKWWWEQFDNFDDFKETGEHESQIELHHRVFPISYFDLQHLFINKDRFRTYEWTAFFNKVRVSVQFPVFLEKGN